MENMNYTPKPKGGSMLEYFQTLIDEHFQRENLIMKEMLEADLPKEDWINLQNFIMEHAHSKFVKSFRKLAYK